MDQTGHARGRRGHAEVAADERPIAQLLCGRCQQYACSLTTVCDRGLSTRVRAVHCLGLISRSTCCIFLKTQLALLCGMSTIISAYWRCAMCQLMSATHWRRLSQHWTTLCHHIRPSASEVTTSWRYGRLPLDFCSALVSVKNIFG